MISLTFKDPNSFHYFELSQHHSTDLTQLYSHSTELLWKVSEPISKFLYSGYGAWNAWAEDFLERSSRAKFSNHFHGCQQIIYFGVFSNQGFGPKTEHRWPQQVSSTAKGHSPEEKEDPWATHKHIMHATLGGASVHNILQFSMSMCKSV